MFPLKKKKKRSRPSARMLLPRRAVPSNTASYIMHQKREELQCSALRGISCLLNSDSRANNTHRHTLDVRDVRGEQAGSTLGRKDKVFMIVTARVVPALFPQPTLTNYCRIKRFFSAACVCTGRLSFIFLSKTKAFERGIFFGMKLSYLRMTWDWKVKTAQHYNWCTHEVMQTYALLSKW